MLTLGFSGCLELYKSEEDFNNMIESRFGSASTLDTTMMSLKRYILAHSQQVEIDKQGRVPMVPILKEKAKIVKDLVSIGFGDHIEIWAKEELEKEEANLNLKELLAPFRTT